MEWNLLLRQLSEGQIPDGDIGSAIVRLSKPLEPERIAAAKEIVLRHLVHQNSWARHEALWFIRWSECKEQKPALINAMRSDPDPDNRGYAALCIAHMMARTGDRDSVAALQTTVLNELEDASVRSTAYGALIEVSTDRSGSDFYTGEKTLDDVDWDWVMDV